MTTTTAEFDRRKWTLGDRRYRLSMFLNGGPIDETVDDFGTITEAKRYATQNVAMLNTHGTFAINAGSWHRRTHPLEDGTETCDVEFIDDPDECVVFAIAEPGDPIVWTDEF